MNRLVNCDTCKKAVDSDLIRCWETQQCEPCHEAWIAKEIAYWRPLWLADRAMKRAYEDEDMGDF